MNIRTNLNEASSERLLAIMKYYNFTSTNHTLNVIISSLHDSLITNHAPIIEVENNDRSSSQNQ